ncbi:MAG: hypothetical protein P9D89_09820, partial [Candidatus Contendobacter sp.]|nr:hypothetical protein [Candidatus Contendobacter sp.]
FFRRLPFRLLSGFTFGFFCCLAFCLLSRFAARRLFPLATDFRLALCFCFPLGLRQPGLSFHLFALSAALLLRLSLQLSPDRSFVHDFGGNGFDFILHGMKRISDIQVEQQESDHNGMHGDGGYRRHNILGFRSSRRLHRIL